MTSSIDYSSLRYLQAKRTVDDRALNAQVFDAVQQRLQGVTSKVSILEIGGGLGSMIDRLIDRRFVTAADYTIVELDPIHVDVARSRSSMWATQGFNVQVENDAIENWLIKDDGTTFDLIIAHAVLDLVDLDSMVPKILDRLTAQGLFWLTINFDGETIFLPEEEGDAALVSAYHLSMDTRTRDGKKIGDSKTGRHLFGHFQKAKADIVAAGSSDWVVYSRNGKYFDDEAYFLQSILYFFECEISRHPELKPLATTWIEKRLKQIHSGELVYIAHQLDFAVARGNASVQ